MAITNASHVPASAHTSLANVLRAGQEILQQRHGLFSASRPLIVKEFKEDGTAVFAQQSIKAYLKDKWRGVESFNVQLARDFVAAKGLDKASHQLYFHADIPTAKAIVPAILRELTASYQALSQSNAQDAQKVEFFVQSEHALKDLAKGTAKARANELEYGNAYRRDPEALLYQWNTEHYKKIFSTEQ